MGSFLTNVKREPATHATRTGAQHNNSTERPAQDPVTAGRSWSSPALSINALPSSLRPPARSLAPAEEP